MVNKVYPGLSGAFLLCTAWLMLSACQTGAPESQPASGAYPASTYKVMVVEQGRGQVKLFDEDGTLLDSIAVGYNPHEIELDAKGKRAFVSNFGVEDYDNTIGTPGTTLSVIDLEDIKRVREWPIFRKGALDTCKAPHGLKLKPPGHAELYVNAEYGDSMLVFDAKSGRILRSFPIAKGNHNFEFSASGDTLWLMAGANGVYRYNANTGQETGHFPTASPARGLTFNANRDKLIISGNNEVYVLDPSSMTLRQHFSGLGVGQIIYSSLSADESLLLSPCPYDDLVLVLDMDTGEVLRRISTGKAPIYVKLDPTGSRAFVANALDDHMSVIDLEHYTVRPFGSVFKPNGFLFLKP